MTIPLQKLRFIDHPRYGSVYPVVSVNTAGTYPNLARISTGLLSLMNGLVVYSTFYMPIFTAEFSAIVAHPFILLPSLLLNYYLQKRHYNLFYGNRTLVANMFLKPCGRKFIVETRDGQSCEVTITDVFMTKYLSNSVTSHIEF